MNTSYWKQGWTVDYIKVWKEAAILRFFVHLSLFYLQTVSCFLPSSLSELTLPQFYNFLHEMERAKASMECFSWVCVCVCSWGSCRAMCINNLCLLLYGTDQKNFNSCEICILNSTNKALNWKENLHLFRTHLCNTPDHKFHLWNVKDIYLFINKFSSCHQDKSLASVEPVCSNVVLSFLCINSNVNKMINCIKGIQIRQIIQKYPEYNQKLFFKLRFPSLTPFFGKAGYSYIWHYVWLLPVE